MQFSGCPHEILTHQSFNSKRRSVAWLALFRIEKQNRLTQCNTTYRLSDILIWNQVQREEELYTASISAKNTHLSYR